MRHGTRPETLHSSFRARMPDRSDVGATRPRCAACRRAANRIENARCLHRADSFLASADGSIVLTPSRHGDVVLVGRVRCGADGLESSTTLSFRSQASFSAWCDQQQLRFDNPMLFERLVKSVNALFTNEQRV